jgi:hypothetical protein
MPVTDGISNRLVNLEGAFGRVFERAMDWAGEDFRREIESVRWDWPNETIRSNGQPVGSPRNIVDIGGLRDSQRRENQTDITTDFVWTGGDSKAYALEVHDGYTSKGGSKMPARAFTDDTLFRLNDIVESLIADEVTNG